MEQAPWKNPADQEKRLLRRMLLEQRKALTPAQRCLLESDIARQVLAMSAYLQAQLVLLYLSTPWEIGTSILVAHALGLGKAVAIPRCYGQGEMDFCLFDDHRKLVPGFHGILEPARETPALKVSEMTGAFCVVPALAADRQGYRLGYGGGYYDRFLLHFPGETAVLVREETVLEQLPREPFDHPVNWVVTEKRVIPAQTD